MKRRATGAIRAGYDHDYGPRGPLLSSVEAGHRQGRAVGVVAGATRAFERRTHGVLGGRPTTTGDEFYVGVLQGVLCVILKEGRHACTPSDFAEVS